jgi:hypothetical protein
LDYSGVNPERLFQRSFPPPLSNDPFISFHSPLLVGFHGEKRKESTGHPCVSAAASDPARICRKNDKGTQGESARGRIEEGYGRHHHLPSQPAKCLSAAGNYQEATGCPTLPESQAVGEFVTVFGASLLIFPQFFMYDTTERSPLFPQALALPETLLFRTENTSLV